MKNIDMFYFDVDGTLFDHNNDSINQEVFEAINKLKEKGHYVAICTGRTKDGLSKPSILDEVDWDGYVLANGGQVFDKDFNQIRKVTCKPEFIHDLIKYNEEVLFLEGDQNYTTCMPNQRAYDGFAKFRVEKKDIPPIIDYNDECIYKAVTFNLEKLLANAPANFLDDYFVLSNAEGVHEIFPKETTKFHGIEVLNEHLGINTYAGFGDGTNDIEFLQHADIAVAMGNAHDELKKIASYITDTVTDNGVVSALVTLGYID